jgi:hypothetical protein
MTLVSARCPNCGTPIDAPRVGNAIRCPSCASMLEVQSGGRGSPLPRLVAIGKDTGFIAKNQAVTRLKAQLDALHVECDRMEGAMPSREEPDSGCLEGVLALSLLYALFGVAGVVTGLLRGAGAVVWFGLLVPVIAGARIAYLDYKKRKEIILGAQEREYVSKLEALQALRGEIAERENLLARLEAELDLLTGEM